VEIEATQAGQRLSCACGTELEVPSLRGIRALRPAATVGAPRRRRWSPGRGWLFVVGLLLAVLSFIVGALNLGASAALPELIPPEAPMATIAAEVDAAGPAELLWRWKELRDKGLGPYQLPPHVQVELAAAHHRRMAVGSLLLCLVGVSLAFGAWLARGGRQSPQRPGAGKHDV
jgi:hypothetical protein